MQLVDTRAVLKINLIIYAKSKCSQMPNLGNKPNDRIRWLDFLSKTYVRDVGKCQDGCILYGDLSIFNHFYVRGSIRLRSCAFLPLIVRVIFFSLKLRWCQKLPFALMLLCNVSDNLFKCWTHFILIFLYYIYGFIFCNLLKNICEVYISSRTFYI